MVAKLDLSMKKGEPMAKRRRMPNTLYHNEMYIVMVSPEKKAEDEQTKNNLALIEKKKEKSRKTEPIPAHIITESKKSAEKRKSLSTLDVKPSVKRSYSCRIVEESPVKGSASVKRSHGEQNKQLKHTPKIALKLPHKKLSTPKADNAISPVVNRAEEKKLNTPSSSKKSVIKKNEVQPVRNNSDQTVQLQQGSKFKSFDEFSNKFEIWKIEQCHNFRVASSETLKNIDGSIDPTCRYRYVVYQCVHYGQPRIRGTGKRPNQNYLPCGCKAMLRLVYSFDQKVLVINKLWIEHSGHEPSANDENGFQTRRYARTTKVENDTSSSSPISDNNTSSSVSTPTPVDDTQKMTDALYYQQQLQLVAALLPQSSYCNTDYSSLVNNVNMLYPPTVSDSDPSTSTIYRPQPTYTLSSIANSAFCRVQPITFPPNGSDKENTSLINMDDPKKSNTINDCSALQPLAVAENTHWGPREYADLNVL